MSEPVITIRDLNKSFDDLHVLRGIDLDVYQGEILVILGGSGSGKSVLLKCVTGLMPSNSGSIVALGNEIVDLGERELLPLRKQMGVMFQGGALFDSMNVFDNIAFSFREHSPEMPEEEVKSMVERLLGLVRLPDIGEKMPAELSGGMQKRVALTRAIALRPDVIFYDEPTTGLDPETARSIYELITAAHHYLKNTSVIVSHDIELAFTIADRIAFLKEGRMAYVGTPSEIRTCGQQEVCDFIGDFYQSGVTGQMEGNHDN